MDEPTNTNAAPAAPAPVPAVKKPRKPRTPKAKPPKKERVLLGGIVLGSWDMDSEYPDRPAVFNKFREQPPADIANDVVKVAKWAEGQADLAKAGPITMIRQYNATLKVTSTVKLDSSIEIIKEVPQNQETV